MTRARHIVEFIKLKALASFQEINDYFNERFSLTSLAQKFI